MYGTFGIYISHQMQIAINGLAFELAFFRIYIFFLFCSNVTGVILSVIFGITNSFKPFPDEMFCYSLFSKTKSSFLFVFIWQE